MEQTPQLLQIILHRGTREDQTILRSDRHYSLVNLRFGILNFLSFIQDHIEPAAFLTPLEELSVRTKELIGCNDNTISFEGLINNLLFLVQLVSFRTQVICRESTLKSKDWNLSWETGCP